jgi:hypothetical protein
MLSCFAVVVRSVRVGGLTLATADVQEPDLCHEAAARVTDELRGCRRACCSLVLGNAEPGTAAP